MNDMSIYGSLFPVVGNANPFALLEKAFDEDFFLGGRYRTPAIDVREEDNRYVVEAELPGMSEKDIKLELKEGMLCLSSAKTEEQKSEGKNGTWLRRERREFSLNRNFELPDNADGEKIEAVFKDGVLSIVLPKKPQSEPKQVPVRAA